MQRRILHNLIGPKDTVLLGQNGATLVSEDINDIDPWLRLNWEGLIPIG